MFEAQELDGLAEFERFARSEAHGSGSGLRRDDGDAEIAVVGDDGGVFEILAEVHDEGVDADKQFAVHEDESAVADGITQAAHFDLLDHRLINVWRTAGGGQSLIGGERKAAHRKSIALERMQRAIAR